MAAPAVGAGQKAADRPRRPRRLTGRRAEPQPPRGLDEAEVERLLAALTAVRDGDFRVRLRVPGDADAPMARLATVVNEVVERNRHLTGELDRVRRVVGRDGRLDERLRPGNAEGAWAGAVTAANDLVDELVRPTVEVGRVLGAVAAGDLTQMIDLRSGDQRLRGEFLRMARTVNGMVAQLRDFADEVTRVAREVGTDGKLGGQARVRGVSGTWRDLTDSVNTMASRLTNQVRDIALVTTAVANGDLSRTVTVDVAGEMLELKTTVNTMVDQLRAFADEVTRVAREVGTDGVLGGKATVPGVAGTWKDLTDNVNSMAGNLTAQLRDIAQVTTAVARGDLSRKITVDVAGELLGLKTTVNTMVDQLSGFADEVTRVAREVGSEGRLGGQAEVPGASGTWRDLTDSVNLMAGTLTAQVRNIAEVTTAVARGDLRRKIDVDARGEILELKTTINTMVDQLSAFADEVTRVAREVGTEGKLGVQAEVEGVSGTWKRLTESVNQLASTLTIQLRAIADVSTGVTRGDLTRKITVDAAGEVAALKDTINQMIATLRETTRANQEQDWLKTNLARISGIMQGQRDMHAVARLIMSELTPMVTAQCGAFFLAEAAEVTSAAEAYPDGRARLRMIAGYGYPGGTTRDSETFAFGETLVGQAAAEGSRIHLTDVPAGYVRISSALGSAPPAELVVLPVLFEGRVLAVIELATFTPFSPVHLAFLDQITETIGVTVNTIIANSRTEELLNQSRRLTDELQVRSGELQGQQEQLRRTNTELEVKNAEIEEAGKALADRAEQLALSSRYKSEFLANMSHELRTPLNSLLILARLLADNPSGNLTAEQVKYADVIHGAGSDLLQLIDDILDLSKVEAGKMDSSPADVSFTSLIDYVENMCRPLTADKGLGFTVSVAPDLPRTLHTDGRRLQQILRNLLSNAVKFTESGQVRLVVKAVDRTRFQSPSLRRAPGVVAFQVVDTGIGIAADKLKIIFEAFQQADGTTSRRYGGTGLGLSISREIARLLGGEIEAESVVGRGSTFTLHLPMRRGAPVPPREPSAYRRVQQAAGEPVPGPVVPDEALLGRRVLIVDDDVRNVFALASALELNGLEVCYADNGDAALAALAGPPPVDAVLMDVMLPGMDGNEAMAAIRARPEHADLPIIAVTAKAMNGDRERSLAAGASDYVTKPVDTEHLLGLLRDHFA